MWSVVVSQMTDDTVHTNGKSQEYKGSSRKPGDQMWVGTMIEQFVAIPNDGKQQGGNGTPQYGRRHTLHCTDTAITGTIFPSR